MSMLLPHVLYLLLSAKRTLGFYIGARQFAQQVVTLLSLLVNEWSKQLLILRNKEFQATSTEYINIGTVADFRAISRGLRP